MDLVVLMYHSFGCVNVPWIWLCECTMVSVVLMYHGFGCVNVPWILLC